MMNQHLPAGPPHMNAAAMPTHHNQPSRRQQEYHNQFHGQLPHSPAPMHNPYAHYGPPAYYTHPAQHPANMGYPPRWQQPYMPAYPMPPQQQYAPPPRSPMSPMIVSSQVPPPQAPPMTPVSRQSSYMPPPSHSPAPLTPSTSIPQSIPSPVRPESVQSSGRAPSSRRSSSVAPPALTTRMPFYPDLPWYSVSKESFPPKALKRRRKRQDLVDKSDSVALPSRSAAEVQPEGAEVEQSETAQPEAAATVQQSETNVAAPAALSTAGHDTPLTSEAPSEAGLVDSPPATAKSTEASSKPAAIQPAAAPSQPAAQQTHGRKATKTAVPIIPALPTKPAPKPKAASSAEASATLSPQSAAPAATAAPSVETATEAKSAEEAAGATPASPAKPAAPKSWADLVRAKNAGAAAAAASAAVNGAAPINGTGTSRASSVAEALKQYNVDHDEKIAFLEPRGLVNTGNMCYMNSILQILVFCTPFYNFLDQVSKRAAHSFKSDTPLVDAMIMFMKEFKIIDSAESAEKLRMRLKQEELEQYGDSITPEYVYDTIKRLPRFSSMRRGHQQDAEEFLGFLLAGMHDECAAIIRSQPDANDAPSSDAVASPTSDAGWLEVGPKQKSAITRESGDLHTSPSPLTRIFGGQLRSELRVAGLKNSVTLEPYQPLQLDIGAPHINNITDALRNLTKPETLTGDFGGRESKATKQVFIESLPPVLILHLKRFQYDNTGGTQKIWKKIGYPLHLEIPKEVFAPAKRAQLNIKGQEKYRLLSVVYHHGKSAAGGHYTVDILRQDEREWCRVDDTLIRRIRAEDVAEGGAEEDPRVLAKALEQHASDANGAKKNLFEGLDGEGDNESVRSWSEVNGSSGAAKKLVQEKKKEKDGSGKSTPTPARKDASGVRDNKVAYILFYERVKG